MKRTLLFPLLLAAGCIAAASPTSAQLLDAPIAPQRAGGDTNADQAREDFARAEERIETLRSVGLSTQPPSNKQSLRDKLRPVVVESFVARQRLQQAELAELHRRLAEIEQSLATRQKHMDAIVDSRLDELLTGRTGQAVTRVHSHVAGEVLRIGQSDEADGQGGQSLTVGDKVAAGEALVVVGVRTPDGKAWKGSLITAPIEGIIVERNVNVGNVVKPTDTLFKISSPIAAGEVKTASSAADPRLPGHRYPAGAPYLASYLPSVTSVPKSPVGLYPSITNPANQQVKATSNAGFGFASPNQPDSADHFDLATRERMAQADMEEAQAVRDAAQYDYDAHLEANSKAPGSTPKAGLKSLEAKVRIAEAKLQGAKVMLEGLQKERTELESAADAAVSEAEAERKRAAAKVATYQADWEATGAVIAEREAEVEGATVNA